MWAASPDTHPSTPFSKGHWPTLISSVLEPVGLTEDKRRPDGLTLNPWYRGRNLIWDVTVVKTFSPSHYIVSVTKPGSVATDAADQQMLTIQWHPWHFNTLKQLQLKPLVCIRVLCRLKICVRSFLAKFKPAPPQFEKPCQLPMCTCLADHSTLFWSQTCTCPKITKNS